mmetsp:Transcript_2949/g.5348  ORF Transcript_2949/g.5348 Transcript_2949/m.5348 type:complete len:208 (-) Transcript_2949:540-1163(-)
MVELTGVDTILTLERSRVKRNTLIPSVDRVVIAVDAFGFAIIESILEFTDNIHHYVHIHGSFFDCLSAASEAVLSKVGVSSFEVSVLACEGGQDPLIGVVKGSVVFDELFVVTVWTGGTIIHLILSTSTEALDSPRIVVVFKDVVSIIITFGGTFDGKLSTGSETSNHGARGVFREISFKDGTDLAPDVIGLNIRCLVLDSDYLGSW